MAPVPVNLVTGFLGSGKTTAILHLLAHRPRGERWAVLVNEFGELGIDGTTLGEARDVVVREIAGGCVCCTGNVPMRVALTQLLRVARPHRLIVEPTGLGHAAGVYDTLAGEALSPHVTLASVVCMVDPRQAADPRIAAREAFRDQLSLADVIVINKLDLARPAELDAARSLAESIYPPRRVLETERGALDASLLDDAHVHRDGERTEHASSGRSWSIRFPRGTTFDRARIAGLFATLNAPGGIAVPGLVRAKGVFRVGRDALLADWAAGHAAMRPIAYRRDSRATFIVAPDADVNWDALTAAFGRAASPGQ